MRVKIRLATVTLHAVRNLSIFLGALLVWAQGSKKFKTVLATLGKNVKVTQAEFEYAYQKSHGGIEAAKTHTLDQYRAYLEAYLDFRRKVEDALRQNLHQTPGFRNEYENYLRQLARSYLMEKTLLDSLLYEAYERMKIEVHASHLMVRIGSDTLSAYQKILAYKDSIQKGGRSFSYMAKMYSEDPSAKQNQGDIGYFSVFDMVWPFEEAAYNAPIGEVVGPIRSRYGYHLVQVHERLPSTGRRKAAHILIRWGPTYAAKDSIQAFQRAQEIYQRLQKGEDFAKLAAEMSDDPLSARTGGELGWMRLLPAMEVQKRKLQAGQYSAPFRTPYGYHILKVLEVKPIPPFSEAKTELKNKLLRDERYRVAEKKFVEKLKKAYRFQLDSLTYKTLATAIETLATQIERAQTEWSEDFRKKRLFSLQKVKKIYTVQDFIDYAMGLRRTKAPSFQEDIENFISEKILEYEQSLLPEKYEEFRLLRDEYYNGLLFFAASEKAVWRKAVEDTSGLRAYYESVKTKFPAPDRWELIEIVSRDSLSLAELPKRLDQPTFARLDSLNRAGSFGWRITPTIIPQKDLSIPVNGISWSPIQKSSDKNFIRYYVKRFLPAGYKTFEEVRLECINGYQAQLEKNWIEQLRKLYPAKINEKVLRTLFR